MCWWARIDPELDDAAKINYILAQYSDEVYSISVC